MSEIQYKSSGGGAGDIVGPAGATDNAIPRFDGASGTLVQDSGVLIDDSDNLTVPGDLTVTGDIQSDANSNTAVGTDAVDAITSGVDNTGVGEGALTVLTTGGINTAVGKNALALNVTGFRNVAVGVNALSSSVGNDNTAIGNNALASNTTGLQNTGVGQQALQTVTTNGNNTALGHHALRLNTAVNNTAVGSLSLTKASSGGNNTAIGERTLENLTIGTSNTAIGRKALNAVVSGLENTAIGNEALALTTGSSSTAVGSKAMSLSTAGNNNVAMGRSALKNVSGSSNTGIGQNVLEALAGGAQNVGVGAEALASSITGNNGVAIGYRALFVSTGDDNTALGHLAGNLITAGTNNICLGKAANPPNPTDSNHVVLGPATITATILRGNVGIDRTDPLTALDFANVLSNRRLSLWRQVDPVNDHQFYGFGVNTNVLRYQVPLSTASHVFYSGAGNADSVELMRIQGDGRVGIGITPVAQLDIKGTLTKTLTGTVSVSAGNNVVTGVGTSFLTELESGSVIQFGGEIHTVVIVGTDTQLVIDANHVAGASGVVAQTDSDYFNIVTGDNGNVFNVNSFGQMGLNTLPDDSALVDFAHPLSGPWRGFLPPRLTEAQRDVILSPATGLEIYNTDTDKPEFFNGSVWGRIGIDIVGSLSVALTGTVDVTIGTAAVTGTGTAFLTELEVGSPIKIDGEIFTVIVITSDTALTLDSNHAAGASSETAFTDPTLFSVINGDAKTRMTVTGERVFIESDFRSNIGLGTGTLTAATSGAQNTAIGDLAGNLITTGSNNLCLGKDADTSAPGADNEIVIGNASNTKTLLRGIVTGGQFNPTDELNVVNVYVAADLPDTLVAGVKYILRAPITVSTTKTFPGTGVCEIASSNLSTNTLTYSGTGNLFAGTSVEGVRLNVQVNSSSTGTLFSVTGSGATAFFDVGLGGFDGWDNLGTLTSFGLVDMNFVTVTNFDSGLTLNSVVEFFSTQSHFFNASDQATDYLTFDANILEISVNNVSFVPIGDERIFNINSSAAVNAFIDDITGVTAANLYFNTAGLVKTSPGIIINNASNIEDSKTSAELQLKGNTVDTNIPAVGAMVEFNLNVDWVSNNVERLVVSTNGLVQSIGLRDSNIKIDGNINLEPATATKDISCRVILVKAVPVTVTFTNATNLINETSTALADGDLVSFRDTAGTLPAEIRKDVVYFVVSKLTNSFQVAYTEGGSAIAFTDDGTPTNTYKVAEVHGSIPTNSISAGSARDLITHASIPATLNSESFITVINNTDAVDIQVNSGYQRYFV